MCVYIIVGSHVCDVMRDSGLLFTFLDKKLVPVAPVILGVNSEENSHHLSIETREEVLSLSFSCTPPEQDTSS